MTMITKHSSWAVQTCTTNSKVANGCHTEQEAQLPQRDHTTRYVSTFILCFMRYGSYKGFKQQK